MGFREFAGLMAIGLIVGLCVWWWRNFSFRMATQGRLAQDGAGRESPQAGRSVRHVFPPRYQIIPACLGVGVSVGLFYFAEFSAPFAGAAGLMVGVLGFLLESIIAGKRLARIETQLADSIDLLMGALQAGLSLPKALDTARQESAAPLRPYLDNLVRKIRLGENPASAVRELGERVPLETFQLFSLTLSAQWWTGGSLAPTLSVVGRTIRDRIELSRRIRTQAVEAKASVIGVLVISYVLTFIMWRANPRPLENFFNSDIGSLLAGAAIGLQALGIVWINRISQVKF
ncbi:MAG: pilus assembly protein TadB [Nitrospirales bacterium]|nr:MAG: pilus assembly protein TadB [Nitrospirales bacterium]